MIRGPFDNSLVMNFGDVSLHQMVSFMLKVDDTFPYRFDVWMADLRIAPVKGQPVRSVGTWRIQAWTMNGNLKYNGTLQYPNDAARAELAVIEFLERQKAIIPAKETVERIFQHLPKSESSYRITMGYECPWTGEINEAAELRTALRYCFVEELIAWNKNGTKIVRTKKPWRTS